MIDNTKGIGIPIVLMINGVFRLLGENIPSGLIANRFIYL